MTGRIAVIGLLAAALAVAVTLWFRQNFVEYTRIEGPVNGFGPVLRLPGRSGGILLSDIVGIQGSSSPLKFRACFKVDPSSLPDAASGAAYPDPTPLTAPDWFDCFDAEALGSDLEAGRAWAVLVAAEIAEDVDLVAAFYPDGRGFAWRQINLD